MADQRSVMRGLEILDLYKPDGVTWNCDAQHDVLYAEGRPPSEMNDESVEELNKLGWQWDQEFDSWRRFT